MSDKIRAVIILCKSRTDGIGFYSSLATEYNGAVMNCIWEFTQCRHYLPVPEDVRVVKTPAFKADPDESIETAMGATPSWKQIRFVSMNGVLYPCVDIKLNVVHNDNRPYMTAVLSLAFGLTAWVEMENVTVHDRYVPTGREHHYSERFAMTIVGGTVADAR